MKCQLDKYIDHKKTKEQYRTAYFNCPLFKGDEVRMSILGIICAGCCLGIQRILEIKKDLLLRQVVDVKEFKRNPDIITKYLPEHLKQYYTALTELGKSMVDVSLECNRCQPILVDKRPIYASEYTEMTQIGKRDLR